MGIPLSFRALERGRKAPERKGGRQTEGEGGWRKRKDERSKDSSNGHHFFSFCPHIKGALALIFCPSDEEDATLVMLGGIFMHVCVFVCVCKREMVSTEMAHCRTAVA